MSFTNPPRDYYSHLEWSRQFVNFILTGSGGNEVANTILAAPDGSPGAPSFRLLVAADIPNLDASKITTGSFDAAIIGSGTLANARINWASPSAIGSTTPAAGTFTTIRANTFYGKHYAYNSTTSIANDAMVVVGFAGGITLTLPTVANRYDGTYSSAIFIKNIAGSNITIARAGADSIDGATSITLAANAARLLFASNSNNWRTFGDA